MRWAALYRRPPILRGVSASQIRADHAANQARINARYGPALPSSLQLRRLPGITVEKRDCGDRIRHFNSGDVKGTIRSVVRCLLVSIDVRRHRLISINYISLLPCHGRGRGFESRRPRHFDSIALHIATFLSKIELNLTHDTTPQTRTK